MPKANITAHDVPAAPLIWRLGLFLLCALWLLAGTVAHDPWKSDDAIHLGIAFGVDSDNWLIPRIVGDPWLATPPLYYWLAALCGKLFHWMLPWHDAARLASSLLGAIFLLTLSASTRHLATRQAALIAPLLAIGTLGFLIPLHDAQPAIVAVAAYSISLLGLACWQHRPVQGGLLLGIGIGSSFLGTGLDGTIAPLAAGLLILIHPAWRARGSLTGVLVAAAIALALIFPWPWLLQQQAPALFDIWWANERTSLIAKNSFSRAHLEMLLWASWPLMPLALWHLWLERRRLWLPQTILPLTATGISLLIFFLGDARPTAILPALVPLCLLAATGSGRLRRGATNAFDWFGMMTFSLITGLIWLGAIAMLTGTPARIAKNFTKPAPGFVADIPAALVVLAIVVTLAWLVLALRMPRSPWRASIRWSLGLTSIWVLLAILWLPWIDYGKSYRSVSADFSRLLGEKPGCIARRNLGLAQRASLDYFNGIRTVSGNSAKNCRYLISQARPQTEKNLANWKLLLETSRPGDKTERLRLYRRD